MGETEVGEYPWQVVIPHYTPGNPPVNTFFAPSYGGSLIGDSWVLLNSNMQVKWINEVGLGEHNLNLTIEAAEKIMKVEKIIESPRFNRGTFTLLKLAEKINWVDHPNIRPVCLPAATEELDYAGATATVAGWGSWIYDMFTPGGLGLSNKTLQEVDMTVLTTEECRQGYVDAGFDATEAQRIIQDDLLCVMTEGLKGPCREPGLEDGIPIVVKSGLNYVQVGVFDGTAVGIDGVALDIKCGEVPA